MLTMIGKSNNCTYEIIQHKEKLIFGTQFHPEMSFDGNNLIEFNRIVLPADMPNGTNGPDYRAIMGPWSTQHEKSKTDNYNFNNQIGELNHNHPIGSVLSGNDKVYAGPIFDVSKGEEQGKNFPAMRDENNEFIVPVGYTLYPIVLEIE